MNDAGCPHLPQRRLFWIVLARLAGGINAVVQDRVIALAAVGARRRHAGIVRHFQAQRIDKPVSIVVGQIDNLAVGDIAIGLGEPGIAFGTQALCFLVVDDLVGLDGRSLVVNLHIADGGDDVVRVIVFDLGRFDEHRRIARRRRRHVLLRADREGQFIRIADLAERRSAADTKPRHRGSENEEHRQRARPAQPEMKTADQMRHKPCSGTSNRIRSLRLRCTAAAVRAIVAASCESGRRSPTASRRLQADSAIALGTSHSHREFRAPSTRQDTVLALCDMPLARNSIPLARRWLGCACGNGAIAPARCERHNEQWTA